MHEGLPLTERDDPPQTKTVRWSQNGRLAASTLYRTLEHSIKHVSPLHHESHGPTGQPTPRVKYLDIQPQLKPMKFACVFMR